MITSQDRILTGSGNPNLYYINQHKQAFTVEPVYPLQLFEAFVARSPDWGLECSCKIEGERLEATRFNIFRKVPNASHYASVMDFFEQVAVRSPIRLNYNLLREFLGHDFDFSKVMEILAGVDLRKELGQSRLKFWLVIEKYPERLARAIGLCKPGEELKILPLEELILVVGFDLFLNGRSEIEMYPNIDEDWLKQPGIQKRLSLMLAKQTLDLTDSCWALGIGISQANPEKILYYRTRDPDNFIPGLRNDLANRVQAFYRHQPVKGCIIGLRESEIIAKKIENINFYYQLSNSPVNILDGLKAMARAWS